MTMMRWDPFSEAVTLRQAMERMFETALIPPGRFGGGPSGQDGPGVPVDVLEHNDQFVVKASLPGVPPEAVYIAVEDNVVTIEGELRDEPAPASPQPATGQPNGKQAQPAGTSPRVYHRERRSGRFFRQLMLPTSIDAGKAQATFEHGVLTLTLPKAEQAKRHLIAITGTGGAQKLPHGPLPVGAR